MKCHPYLAQLAVVVACLLAGPPPAVADQHVTVTSTASPEYTQRKFGGAKPVTETYVFMQGHYFDGTTVDHSIERMPFRRIAEYLAPELALAQYLPTREATAADLLLVVHWGTTVPRVTMEQLRAVGTTSLDTTQEKNLKAEINATLTAGGHDGIGPLLDIGGGEAARQIEFAESQRITDGLENEMSSANNAQLLGYTKELRLLSQSVVSSDKEYTLRANMNEERYFVIVKAYDLHTKPEPGRARRAVWSLYVNIRSPGHNFPGALNLMGIAATNYFGRTTDGVQTLKTKIREGTVNIPPFVILGEVK